MKELSDNNSTERERNQLLFKVDVPLSFYIIRACLIFGLLILFVFQVDFEYILIYLLILLIKFFNSGIGIIEIYPEYFKLKRFSIYGKGFQKLEEYNYKDMWDFEFEKGEYNIWIDIVSFVIPYRSGSSHAYRSPCITFKYKEADGSFEINKRFNHLSIDFEKAFEMIDEKVSSKEHQKLHHTS